MPAVVAMRHKITDPAAIAFSGTLYRRLAAGDPIDAAVTEGRIALNGSSGSSEWATPMLFMRLPDGHLFKPTSAAAEKLEDRAEFIFGNIESKKDVQFFGEIESGSHSQADARPLHTSIRTGDIKTEEGVFIAGRMRRS